MHASDHNQPTRRSERGQAAVEFALVLPFLLMILFIVIEVGHAFWSFQQLSAATSEGARKAAISRTSTNPGADVEAAVINAAPGLDPDSLSVTTVSSWDAGDPATVNVTYALDSVGMGLLGRLDFDGTLESSRTTRVES